MAKKPKVEERPAIYAALPTPTREQAARCVVIDQNNERFVFDTRSHNHIVAFDALYECFDEFLKAGKNTILARHAEEFSSEPPKKQDIMTTALMTWASFLKRGNDRTKEGNPINVAKAPVNQETGRRSSLLTRVYTRTDKKLEVNIPRQSKLCLEILEGASPVTEENLRRLINDRAAELKTRQDPWRIFQFYRPALIQAGLIRHD